MVRDTFQLPPQMQADLKAYADRKHVSKSEVVRRAIQSKLKWYRFKRWLKGVFKRHKDIVDWTSND